jgi:pimeloyl-ACP methyl ester carboxylesterase
MHAQLAAVAPYADAIAATRDGRRRATQFITNRFEHIPPALIAHLIQGAAGCTGTTALVVLALRDGYDLDAAAIACPVRVVWGTGDRLLPWPMAAERFRSDWLPHADWVELDGVGHCPQLDVPLEAAQLILGASAG